MRANNSHICLSPLLGPPNADGLRQEWIRCQLSAGHTGPHEGIFMSERYLGAITTVAWEEELP